MKYLDLDRIWSYMGAAMIAFFEPITAVLVWMFIFILADMVSGMFASLREGKHLESHKMQKTVMKVIMYSTCIILMHGIDTYMITIADCGFAKIGSTIICGIELYSILENFYRATGNKVFKVLTTFTLNKIKDKTGIDLEEK
jgi:phage-related holin